MDLGRPSNLVIPTDRVPPAAYQAIYHHLTRKTESISKVYSGAYIIEKSDIEQLQARLDQVITQYRVHNKRCEITATFDDWGSESFSSIERFSLQNLGIIPCATRLISIEFDFLVMLPTEIPECEEIAQRYKLAIKINQKDDEMVDAVAHLPARRRRRYEFEDDATLHIEYADFTVGRVLQTVFEDWIGSLVNNDPKLKQRNSLKRRVAWLNRTSGAVLILSLVGSAFFEPGAWPTALTPIRFLLLSLSIAIMFCFLSELATDKISSYLSIITPRCVIRLTKGDRDSENRREKTINKYKARIAFWGVAIAVGLLVNLFSSYLATKIF